MFNCISVISICKMVKMIEYMKYLPVTEILIVFYNHVPLLRLQKQKNKNRSESASVQGESLRPVAQCLSKSVQPLPCQATAA